MDGLKKFALAWTAMWGISYILTACFAPWISTISPLIYLALGVVIAVASISTALMEIFDVEWIEFVLLILNLALAVLMIYGGVTSWSGAFIWNVPFPAKELFQVSMAFADFIAAAFMLYLSGELWDILATHHP